MRCLFGISVTLLLCSSSVWAAPNIVVSQADTGSVAVPPSNSDLIAGKIATELPGDAGWHPANTQPSNQLAAFTDGTVPADGAPVLYGLLNDFPPAGQPTKLIQYHLDSSFDINEIRVFSGNNGRDGRVFHTYTVSFSSDGQNFSAPIYVQSHPSGTVNNASNNHWRIVLSQLTDTTGRAGTQVSDIRLNFYAVDNTQGQMRDPFDGVNTFTNIDDNLSAPIESPEIWEIDVFGVPSEVCTNGIDDDGDGKADCEDSDCGNILACQCSNPFADADRDGDVDQLDFAAFQLCYTGPAGPIAPVVGIQCECYDRNGDSAIGEADYAKFVLCISGPSVPANKTCDD